MAAVHESAEAGLEQTYLIGKLMRQRSTRWTLLYGGTRSVYAQDREIGRIPAASSKAFRPRS